MSGTLRTEAAGFRPLKHDHLVLQQAKRALVFRDPRQFGRVRFHHGKSAPEWWSETTPEISARAFNARYVSDFLQRHRRAPVKAVLLLQSGFPGIGNWMADEILWRARLAPTDAERRSQPHRSKPPCAARPASFRAKRFASSATITADPPKSWLIHQRWKSGGICPRDGTPLDARHDRWPHHRVVPEVSAGIICASASAADEKSLADARPGFQDTPAQSPAHARLAHKPSPELTPMMTETTPTPRTNSKSGLIAVVVALLVLAALVAVVLNLYRSEAESRDASIEPDTARAGANRIDAVAKIVSADPVKGDIVVRLDFTPQGSFTSDSGVTLSRDLDLFVSSATGKQVHEFRKGKRMGAGRSRGRHV